jgi:hypothetical protein
MSRTWVVALWTAPEYKRAEAVRLGSKYPFEFAHAIGRSRNPALITCLRDLAAEHCHDLRFASICAWAYGQLRAGDELNLLADSSGSIARHAPPAASFKSPLSKVPRPGLCSNLRGISLRGTPDGALTTSLMLRLSGKVQ